MIEATDLTFGYRRGQPVVSGWSASIARGEIAAIVGPSGSGKSTLLYVLGTLVRPWSGSLSLRGSRVDHMGDGARSDIRSGLIGFVFQDAILDPRRSIIDNVLEGAIYRGDSHKASMERARLLLDKLDVGVEGKRRANDLSGGQQQRVAVCRALLGNPALILADEPTGNLDRANAEVVEAALFEQARAGSTVVVVTHDEALAARCDRTFRL
jgi:ABC-type lipoprotein export system ATPase subunit